MVFKNSSQRRAVMAKIRLDDLSKRDQQTAQIAFNRRGLIRLGIVDKDDLTAKQKKLAQVFAGGLPVEKGTKKEALMKLRRMR